MRLTLHIGSGKTGTSTLQSTLCAHADVLLASGILYPTPLYDKTNHNYLAALVHPMKDMPREFTSGGTLDFDAIRHLGGLFWEDIKRQVADSAAHTVVLSGEYFFGLSEAKMDRLRDLLSEAFDDIHVVAYVRHPASFYVSWMQQIVKASHEIRPPADFMFRAKACLLRYAERFDGQVTVRSAHRKSLVNGSIVHDFVATSLTTGDSFLPHIEVTDVNESMSGEAMCIMQSLRRHGWPDNNGHFSPTCLHVVDVLNSIRDDSPQTPAALRPAIHGAMTERHRADLDWLASEHGVVLEDDALASVEGAEGEPDGWTSGDLRSILAVDEQRLEQTLYHLLKALASSSLRP